MLRRDTRPVVHRSVALQLREAVVPLVELWELMDSPEEERRGFRKVTAVLNPEKEESLSSGVLSVATIKKVPQLSLF